MLLLTTFFTFFAIVTSSNFPIEDDLKSLTTPSASKRDKLVQDVTPTTYTLNFRLENDFVETQTFSGTTTIVFSLNSDLTLQQGIQIHAKDLTFTTTTLKQGTQPFDVTASEADPETDVVTITSTTEPLVTGTYSLTIEYTGLLSNTSMVGLYLSSYVDDYKQTKYVVATQFEDIHARKAFPCFDEPALKAKFTVHVWYPVGYNVLSNTNPGTAKPDGDLEQVRFLTTPMMSTYLVAFIVSEWNCKVGDNYNENTTIQLCSRIDAADKSAKTALDAAPIVLQKMEEYTSYAYSDINKLTLAAIPDFAPGAMENWGMVNFREVDLLWYEGESSNAYKQTVLTVLTHELAHQWFGDLVTLEWWNYLFLNEGFATYFQYYVSDLLEPDWELTKQFVLEQLQPALAIDSDDSTLPLVYDVTNPDYSARTNDVSYNKGGSVLRMLHYILTLDNFKKGLADYINAHKLSTATSDLFWEALQTYATEDVATIMENWVTKTGYPLLTVTSNGADVIISQEQFRTSGESDGTKWTVPITYTLSSDPTKFTDLTVRNWLKPETDLSLTGVLSDSNWIILNNQQMGYYRVNYDDTLVTQISTTLNAAINTIDEISRSQIVDDQLNFAKAGIKDYATVLNFLKFLKNDDSYYSWYSAFTGFDYLLSKTSNNDVRNAIKSYVKELIPTLINSVPVDKENSTDQIYTLKQVLALSWACKVGDETCLTVSKQQFDAYKTDATQKPSSNLKSIVYCYGLQNIITAGEDFKFLWEQYKASKISTEHVTILKALGCVNDAMLREAYLSMVLTEPTIRLQDARYVFSSVYSNNPTGPTEVLNFVIDNYEQLTTHFGSSSTVTSLITTIAGLTTTQDQITKLQLFSQVDGLPTDIKAAATSAIDIATKNLEISTTLEQTFTTYFDISTGAGENLTSHFVTIIVALSVFILSNCY